MNRNGSHTVAIRAHERGKCPDAAYGHNCSGWATKRENPFVADVYGESKFEWLCEGVYTGMIGDI